MRFEGGVAIQPKMDLTTTFVLLAACLAAAALCGWRGARPPDLIRGPRMVPWRGLMLVFATVAFFLLIHLATLGGLRPAG